MAMPRKLKQFNVFTDGVNYVGECIEITLPKLARKMEDYRSGGMSGSVDIDLGMEKLELEVTYGGFMQDVLKSFGIGKLDGVMLRFAGSYQRDDSGECDAVEIVVRGRAQEIDFGNAKAGDNSDFKTKYSLSYYKLTVNSSDLVEIDVVNLVEKIGGVDRLAEHRGNIGL
ncbi:MAG: phage major tail tube protein [Ottowia sp.]|nr:phage major tail tube protein [Ottowia sp.]